MNKDLTTGKPASVLLRFTLPMLLSVAFQQLYNIADSVIAGKFAGEDALAAVGASYPVTMIDLYQEGLLGLLDAANSYKPSERTSFETYAGRCISNRIVSAVRRSSSLKNSFLNNAVPIEEMEDLGADRLSDPQTLLESRDEMDRLLSVIHISLSDFELRVLSLYLGGYKRQEAERKLGISARAFDNAMARVRKKLRQKNNDAKG